MSGSISKIASAVAFPKNKNDNMLYFNVSNEHGQIDMKASYLELELTLNNLDVGSTGASYENVVLGHDGLYYNPSALFRTSKLSESMSGKVYQDLVFTNIISNNLEYWSKGSNNIKADALYSGAGYIGSDGKVVSVFSNAYPDAAPIVKCPLSCLYPGSIGDADLFPQDADLEFRYLLEPQYNVFMRAVNPSPYVNGVSEVGATGYAFLDIVENAVSVSAGTTGSVEHFSENQYVFISAIQGADHVIIPSKITETTPDVGGTPGTITFETSPAIGSQISDVSVFPILSTQVLSCEALPAGNAGTELTFINPPPTLHDLYQGTTVLVFYTTVTAGGVSSETYIKTSLKTITGSPQITNIELTNPLPVPASGGALVNIFIYPLYTNLDSSNWSLNNAHLVLYRRQVPVSKEKQMLISNFESVNTAMVGGLNRFLFNLKMNPNTYNAYVLTPDSINLYSVAGGSATNENLRSYLFSVDDKPLTSIYVDSQSPAVHNDNLVNVLSNSPQYKPQNINQKRDVQLRSQMSPILWPAKVFHSTIKGEPNVQEFNGNDRNLKIELVADNGKTTPQKMVYVFLEKYALV